MVHKWEKNESLIGIAHKKNQSFIKITLGTGVISFESLGMHDLSVEVRPKQVSRYVINFECQQGRKIKIPTNPGKLGILFLRYTFLKVAKIKYPPITDTIQGKGFRV